MLIWQIADCHVSPAGLYPFFCFFVDGTQLSGTIPDFLYRLTKLSRLRLCEFPNLESCWICFSARLHSNCRVFLTGLSFFFSSVSFFSFFGFFGFFFGFFFFRCLSSSNSLRSRAIRSRSALSRLAVLKPTLNAVVGVVRPS